ncbi:MAG: hypothetical protein P8X79_17795 [Reinekea sp.]
MFYDKKKWVVDVKCCQYGWYIEFRSSPWAEYRILVLFNFNEPMGAPAIFEKQIEIKLLHPASTLESRIQV